MYLILRPALRAGLRMTERGYWSDKVRTSGAFCLAAAFAAGIALGRCAPASRPAAGVLLGLGFVAFLGARGRGAREILWIGIVVLIFFLLGSWRHSLAVSEPPRDISLWAGLRRAGWVDGTIATDFELDQKRAGTFKVFHLNARQVWAAGAPFPASGDLRIEMPAWLGPVEAGSFARVFGRVVRKPFGPLLRLSAESARPCVWKKGSRMWQAALEWRRRLQVQSQALLPRAEAALLEAILLGGRSNLPEEVKTDFIRTGTFHILSISGLHVTLLGGLIYLLLKILRVPRPVRLFASAALIAAYAAWVGPKPPIVRSALMMGMVLVGKAVGRPSDPLHLLSLAALVILWVSPAALWDAGFQLSFICVWAIFELAPRLGGAGASPLAVSTATWLASAPLIAFHFKMFSPVTIAANLVIVPISSAALSAGVGFFLLGNLFPSLQPVLAAAVQIPFAALIWAGSILARVPGGWFEVEPPAPWIPVVYYGLLWLWTNLPRR